MPQADCLPELALIITRQDLVRYAGAANDYLPQHWDQAMMQGQGFADVVVHGWLGCAHLLRAATLHFTPGAWDMTEYSVRYRQPLSPGPIVCGGTIMAIDAQRSTVDGWIKDASGAVVTTAEMTFVRRSGPDAI
ncbi:MaoC/PaaZ C-terminal domain-containing protein [Novosphingobium sp.]|uniref:MaoC family dehydratase n=1 Tax=Novosphingobium sp. TaxID=1874826 RepID=UPI0025CC97CA|nr:MaoC/PaaZ C-terminal domain-containing protein [Novosphingobium sp.]